MNQFPDVLREAAAEVEERVLRLRFFEEGQDASVARVAGNGEFEKSEAADAGIWFAGPCSISLCTCQLSYVKGENGGTDDFKNVRFNLFGRDMAVVLQEFTPCGVEAVDLWLVPRNVFGIRIDLSVFFLFDCGCRHLVCEIDVNEQRKEGNDDS